MAGLYPTLVISLAYSASAFIAPAAMAPIKAGASLRRMAAILTSTSSRRLHSSGTSMSAQHFDYLVIGGGSGGVASARRAATYDAKVIVSSGSYRWFGPDLRMCQSGVLLPYTYCRLYCPLEFILHLQDTALFYYPDSPYLVFIVIPLDSCHLPSGSRSRGERNGRHLCQRRLCS